MKTYVHCTLCSDTDNINQILAKCITWVTGNFPVSFIEEKTATATSVPTVSTVSTQYLQYLHSIYSNYSIYTIPTISTVSTHLSPGRCAASPGWCRPGSWRRSPCRRAARPRGGGTRRSSGGRTVKTARNSSVCRSPWRCCPHSRIAACWGIWIHGSDI